MRVYVSAGGAQKVESVMSCFDSGVLPWFGLPPSRPSPSMYGSPQWP
jgi:hypothetical protein